MSPTWRSEKEPESARPSIAGWMRAGLRGLVLGSVTFGCLALMLVVRLIERPLFGLHRPITPYITQFVCRSAFFILGMKHASYGTPMVQKGGIVANHSSWLDIFTLNARKRIYFVSKAEISRWPGIGLLAKATGTVFIERDRRRAAEQKALFEARLEAGHKLLFFPEGTSTDGLRILPFNPTLFAAFLEPSLRDHMFIQPVTVLYTAPEGEDARFYGWWGDMEFGAHLLKVLAARRQGRVDVYYHAPIRVADFSDRKALAKACEDVVRGTFNDRAIGVANFTPVS